MKTSSIYKEAKRLHNLGLAIIPLYPKSKRPKIREWTSGPRLTWQEFSSHYSDGDNIGVRLGEASKLENGKYLACIDIDIKDQNTFKPKAEKFVKTFFKTNSVPEVISGSGNGSRHLYFVTEKPFKMLTFLKEKAGEICAYSTGRQMVLAPSIHDTTGKEYKWKHSLNDFSDLPLMEGLGKLECIKKENDKEILNDWKPEKIDLAFSDLDSDIVDSILYANVEDRSSELLKVSKAMVRIGWTDNQIISVLTDTNYELGKVAYAHAHTESRARAAKWLLNFTIKKARTEADAREIFERTPLEESILNSEEQTTQTTEMCLPPNWQDQLNRTKAGSLIPTLNNVLLILENEIGRNIFKRDIFALSDTYGTDTPWGGKNNESITDDEVLKLKVWFTKKYGIEPRDAMLEDAIGSIALENSFHPVRDYLDSLKWDGKTRLDSWLRTYLKANMPEPYLSEVSRKTLCAMIARIYKPGIKFDHVLILNGPQGIGKSTAAQILASPPWFLDRLPDLRDKDSMLNLQGIWVVEMGELTNMRASSVETYKAFLSSQVDKFRLPYGSRRQDFKRQCIIMGSSNPTEFLNDTTGNRRFWIVKVKQCAFEALKRDRDQLLAEAKWVWENLDEQLYLEGLADNQQRSIALNHMHDDVDTFLEEKWDDFTENPNNLVPDEFRLEALFQPLGVFAELIFSKDAKRVAKLLRKRGYEKVVIHGGRKMWVSKNSKESLRFRLNGRVTNEL